MITEAQIWRILQEVPDPEIPILSVLDLGIVRHVQPSPQPNRWLITITPTYSGCPAMYAIEQNIGEVMQSHGVAYSIETVLSPPWTTEWLTPEGKKKLLAYGIAPPEAESPQKGVLFAEQKPITCPRCASQTTKMISQFGSTACKALHQCLSCKEPFDYFKCF